MTKDQIRHAATVIVIRDPAECPKVLMGQRGAKAAFMPSKFVFPGGALDAEDARIPLATNLREECSDRLSEQAFGASPAALAVAAVRELWEETGQILGQRGTWPDAPKDWNGFANEGFIPAAEPLHFVFRAITPPGRPRRFDARFFLCDAKDLASDPDDFSSAEDELSHLQWIPLEQVRRFDLPFITAVVLSEIAAALPRIEAPRTVPFFNNKEEEALFARLGGQSPLAV